MNWNRCWGNKFLQISAPVSVSAGFLKEDPAPCTSVCKLFVSAGSLEEDPALYNPKPACNPHVTFQPTHFTFKKSGYIAFKLNTMRKIAFSILASLPAFAFAQGGQYTVTGTLDKNYNAPAKVYLQYRTKTATVLDSTSIDGGKFTFQGKLTDDPIMASVSFNAKGTGFTYDNNRQVYLENGVTTITGTDLPTAVIAGTQANIDNAKLTEANKPLDTYYKQFAKLDSATNEVKATDAYKKETDGLTADYFHAEAVIYKKFITENPDSYISLVVLGSYTYSADYADIAPLYNQLSDRLKQTVRGKHFADLLPHIKAVAIGATAPEFAEADTSGTMVDLSSFRGKYVLIDFWASWCGPCRAENPNVVKVFNHYKGQAFTVLGVSLDQPDGKDKWLAAIHGLAWTQVSDLKFWDSKEAGLYAVKGIPQNFLIDPNGKIIAKNLRGDALELKLEEIFGKI
jgi:peroxiredoxin